VNNGFRFAVVNRAPRPRTALAFSLAIALGAATTACSEDAAEVVPSAESATGSATPVTTTGTTAGTTTTLGPYVSPLGDIVGEALYAGSFGILAGLLVRADLVSAVRAEGPFTVFAPTDDAFATIPADTLDAVMADPELLAAVLTYHVVAGSHPMSEAADGDELTTLQGQTLTITKDGDRTFVNGIEIVASDVPATNGTINVLASGVLVPES
jgi:uncharacterized surface protein with fasciclin (FAS1) repeats